MLKYIVKRIGMALGILYSSLYIGMMLAVDILYGILDPRIRVSAKGEA